MSIELPTNVLLELKNYLLEKKPSTKKELERYKKEFCARYSLKRLPKNSEILKVASEDEKKQLSVLVTKPVRTISGVAVIAAMTKPFPCPHGACTMCPGGPDVGMPQSYTGHEPATLRGIANQFDPVKQVKTRLKQLSTLGHPTDKIDLIVMGGTFTSMPKEYQKQFIKGLLDGLNGEPSKTIEEAILKNETAKHRCVGITIETRPDYFRKEHVDFLLELGMTRVELGVQTLFDDVYLAFNRGHDVDAVVKAFSIARDAALKITAHMMLGLPGSNAQKDIESFKILFNDPRFKPDEIKIYPLVVTKNTVIYEDLLAGRYKALTDEETIKRIAKIKSMTPPYVRIKRIMRDIPAHQIVAGPRKSHLRLLAQQYMEKNGLSPCRCIRCREVGHVYNKKKILPDPSNIELVIREYDASNGTEFFLSYEDVVNDIIIGFLRLRELGDNVFRNELLDRPTMVVRELHVYGKEVQIGQKITDAWQHKGFGRKLIMHAEEIARNKGYEKLAIISGIGVREYYRKWGYEKDGVYVSKLL